MSCGQQLSYTQIIVWVFLLLENAAQLMKMLKSNISSACTCFLLNQLWTIIILKPQFWINRDKHHFMICMMKKSSAANFSSQHPTFFVLFRVAPPKTNQLSSSCRSRYHICHIFSTPWTLGARLIAEGLILSHWKHVLTSSYDRCIKGGS